MWRRRNGSRNPSRCCAACAESQGIGLVTYNWSQGPSFTGWRAFFMGLASPCDSNGSPPRKHRAPSMTIREPDRPELATGEFPSMRKLTSLATAAAIVLTSVGFSATPAEARGRHGGWGYRHHDRISTGDVLGGLLIIGTIAAIASAASKDRRERAPDYRYDPPYREDERYEVPRYNPTLRTTTQRAAFMAGAKPKAAPPTHAAGRSKARWAMTRASTASPEPNPTTAAGMSPARLRALAARYGASAAAIKTDASSMSVSADRIEDRQ